MKERDESSRVPKFLNHLTQSSGGNLTRGKKGYHQKSMGLTFDVWGGGWGSKNNVQNPARRSVCGPKGPEGGRRGLRGGHDAVKRGMASNRAFKTEGV